MDQPGQGGKTHEKTYEYQTQTLRKEKKVRHYRGLAVLITQGGSGSIEIREFSHCGSGAESSDRVQKSFDKMP